MLGDVVHSQIFQIFDRRTQADGARHVWRTRFKFVRNFVVGCFLKGHGADHVPATLIGRHRLEESELAIQDSDSCRSVSLVAGENIKIAVQGLNIDRKVRGGLGTIHQNRNTRHVCHLDHLSRRGLIVPRALEMCSDSDDFWFAG